MQRISRLRMPPPHVTLHSPEMYSIHWYCTHGALVVSALPHASSTGGGSDGQLPSGASAPAGSTQKRKRDRVTMPDALQLHALHSPSR
jgi:hypothetical protein